MQRVPKSKMRLIDTCALLGTVVVVLLLGYMTLGRSLQQIRDLSAEQQKLTTRLNYLTLLADKVGQGEAELERLEGQKGELSRRLPDTIDFPGFYGDLSSLATAHGVLIADLTPADASTRQGYVEMAVSLEAEASLDDFHAFLFAVTGLDRLVKIERLAIGPSTNAPTCSIDMTVTVYGLNEKATADGQ